MHDHPVLMLDAKTCRLQAREAAKLEAKQEAALRKITIRPPKMARPGRRPQAKPSVGLQPATACLSLALPVAPRA